jgi:hypothetical protein
MKPGRPCESFVREPGAAHRECVWNYPLPPKLESTGRPLRVGRAAWSHPDPAPDFPPIQGDVAFYPGAMDACFVDGERVSSQPAAFYAGWITSDRIGPFKGGAGTRGW